MNELLRYLNPIVVFFSSIGGVVAVIVGTIQNPEGAVNTFLIKIIDLIHPIFPSTPDNLKIFSLLDEVAGSMPSVGRAIVYDVAQTLSVLAGFLVIVKIYKLIPFKAT